MSFLSSPRYSLRSITALAIPCLKTNQDDPLKRAYGAFKSPRAPGHRNFRSTLGERRERTAAIKKKTRGEAAYESSRTLPQSRQQFQPQRKERFALLKTWFPDLPLSQITVRAILVQTVAHPHPPKVPFGPGPKALSAIWFYAPALEKQSPDNFAELLLHGGTQILLFIEEGGEPFYNSKKSSDLPFASISAAYRLLAPVDQVIDSKVVATGIFSTQSRGWGRRKKHSEGWLHRQTQPPIKKAPTATKAPTAYQRRDTVLPPAVRAQIHLCKAQLEPPPKTNHGSFSQEKG